MSEAKQDQKLVIRDIVSVGEEVLNGESLPSLLSCGKEVVAYDGFEPSSGTGMHIAQGLLRAANTNKMTKHGIKFKFWVADWFAMMNHKLGGDLKKIRKSGELMIETWKACGMNLDNVEFIWASDEIKRRSDEYWALVLDIATSTNLQKILRCTKIMGRKEALETEEMQKLRIENTELKRELASLKGLEISEDSIETNNRPIEAPLTASQIFYPVMQCADIFFLGADICSLGMDQRKVNVLALEYCQLKKRKYQPVIVSHHMLMGLDGSTKMSKSNPDNAIFMTDSPGEVKRKIRKAYCRPGDIEKNPILEYVQYIIFEFRDELKISRKSEHGGDVTYRTWSDVSDDFANGTLHPDDLKEEVINVLNELLAPIHEHFKKDTNAKQLLKQVSKY